MINKQSGQISKVLLIIAVVLLIVIVAVFFIIRGLSGRDSQTEELIGEEEGEEIIPMPIYEVLVGSVEFKFISAVDMGNTLFASQSRNPRAPNLTTTERFIKVIVSAQNKGAVHTRNRAWNIGNIIDSEGRVFLEASGTRNWLPQINPCGAILGPEFEPTDCIKIYEVSNIAEGLKIEVSYGEGRELLDLIVVR